MPASITIFTSADTADWSVALDLQKAIAGAAPDFQVDFWERKRYTDTEYRVAVKKFLENTRLFILVHSSDTGNHPDTRFEVQSALEELERRPGGFYIAIVQARTAVLPPALHGLPLFPGPDESLEGIFSEKQVVRTAFQIVEMIRSAGQEKKTPEQWGLHIPLTLPDLQERLHEMSMRYNLTDVLLLLKTIVHHEQLSREILQLEDDFTAVHIKNYGHLSDYQHATIGLKTRIGAIIDALNDDYLLFKNWRILFLDKYRKSFSHRTTAFYFPLDDIRIPVSLNRQDTLTITPSLAEEQEFKRLLLLCQDAISLEKYAAAYNYCEQARTQIDPQSAQLYEYLLITYVKKEGPETIMRRLLDGIPSGFNHVKLFSERYYLYQTAHPPACPSETGIYNLKVAVEELVSALHAVYSQIEGNAILNTGTWTPQSPENKLMVAKCLDALPKLFHSLSETTLFIDTLIIELAGGGKFSWLDRIAIKDDNISLVGNANFDIKGKIDELLRLLEIADTHRIPAKQREMIREDLFWGLLNAAQALALQIKEEQRKRNLQTDTRRSVIRLVQACITGHYLLTRPGDVLEAEKSLLRLAIELLMPDMIKDGGRYDLPAEILVDWFTLDKHGQLVPAATSFEWRDFDAFAVLKKIISDHAGAHHWPTIAENIRKEIWIKYNKTTAAIYETVKGGLQWHDFRRMNDLQARKLLIDCMQRQWIAFRAYPDDDQRFPDQIAHELVGNGLMQWFTINPKVVLNHPDCAQFNFDAKNTLYELIQHSKWSEEEITGMLVHNLFQKVLLPSYAAIKQGAEKQRETCAQILGAMLMAFKSHPLPVYLDCVFEEITAEKKFKWVEIDLRGNWYNASDSFDAVGVLEHLNNTLPLRYHPDDTRIMIANQRWKEQVLIYETEISLIRHENRLPERRMVAEIIQRLKGIYLFWPDLNYLQIPFDELNDRGRIRWYERFIGIFKTNTNHHENHHIHFDLRAERIELKRIVNRYEI